MTLADERTFKSLLVSLSLAGFALVLLVTSHSGIGMSSDAANYVSVARSLMAGRGFVRYDGVPYSLWPPLYPMVLAALGSLGIEVLAAARWLNAATLAVLIYLSGIFFARHLSSRWLAVVATSAVLFSVPLMESFTMAWSDPLFYLFTLLAMMALLRYRHEPRLATLLQVSLWIALAMVQRYVGITLLIVTVPLMVFRSTGVSAGNRWKHTTILVVLAMIPISLWMLRNWIVTSTLTGPRIPPEFTLGELASYGMDTFTTWLLPSYLPFTARGGIVLLLVVTLIMGVVRGARTAAPRSLRKVDAEPVIAFVLVYVLFLVIQGTFTHVDQISSRYLGAIYVFVLVLFLLGAERLSLWLGERTGRPRFCRGLVVVLAALWVLYPVAWTVHRARTWIRQGVGMYVTERWRTSSTLAWFAANPLRGMVSCNQPEAVYAITGKAVHMSPWFFDSEEEILRKASADSGGYLIWLKYEDDFGLHRGEELSRWFHVDTLCRFDDGTVYHLRQR